MPIQVQFVEEGRGIVFTGFGVVTGGELVQCKMPLLVPEREDELRRVEYAVVDLGGVERLEMSIPEIRELADVDVKLARIVPRVSVAIVALKPHVFGLARMWEVYAEVTAWQTAVFRSREEAESWARMNRGARSL